MSIFRQWNWVQIVIALLASSLLFACDEEPATLVIASVSADAEVAARLVRLEARIHSLRSEDATMPKRNVSFAFGKAKAGATLATLPLSFTITQQDEPRVRLELLGYESWARDAAPIIERRELVVFQTRQTVAISIELHAECLDKAELCSDANRSTCQPDGVCGPIEEAMSVATLPGRETFSDFSSRDAGHEVVTTAESDAGAAGDEDDAMPDDALDAAQVTDAGAGDAQPSLTDLPPEPLPACPVENACPLPDYPCLPSDDGRGYSCRGQYAAWPMPDAQADAKQHPSYTVDAANGVVEDEITGLSWQRDLPASYAGCSGHKGPEAGDTCLWEEAKHYCSQLTLAGKRWRLPSKIELESLIDPSHKVPEAFIDANAFPATSADAFWTGSPVALTQLPNHAYLVVFAGGSTANLPTSSFAKVRCVRSARVANAPPTERYAIDEANRSVRDRYTGLEWRTGASAAPVATLEEARQFCTNHGGGYRVPTHKELLTLADVTSPSNAEPSVFARGDGDWLLWSTSPAIKGETLVYYPLSGTSLVAKFTEINPMLQAELHVRCVR